MSTGQNCHVYYSFIMRQTCSFVLLLSSFCKCFFCLFFFISNFSLTYRSSAPESYCLVFHDFLLRIFHHSSAGQQNWGHWCDCLGCSIRLWSCQFALQLSIPFHQVIHCIALFPCSAKELTFVYTMAFHLQMNICQYVIGVHSLSDVHYLWLFISVSLCSLLLVA